MRLFLVFALFAVAFVNAQDSELGKVSKADLQQSIHPKDPSASAAILFKKAHTTFEYNVKDGFVSFTEVSIRLKIYKPEGLSWANYEVPYYVGYSQLSDESIVFSKAFTYNLENGEIVKTKVTSENRFQESINEFWKTKSIAFPNVKVGSIIEFRYILKTQNISELPDFQFQYKIPVNYAELHTQIPEFYIYKAILSGYIDIKSDSKMQHESKSYTSSHGITEYLNYRNIESHYTATDIPALIEEGYVDNIENYYGQIDHELQTIRMPEQTPKQIATTWEDVTKSIYKDEEFGAELEKFAYFETDLRRILAGKITELEKLDAVYDFVKSRMNWNDRFGYYTRKGVEKAYEDRTGNVAEINLMLVAMLRMAGLQANPVIISTRNNGKAPFPSRMRFNYVIAAVAIGNEQVLLDATYKLGAPNILPTRDLNSTGRLVQKLGANSEIDLTPKTPAKQIVNLMADVKADGTVSGRFREQYTNYAAAQFRDRFNDSDKVHFTEKKEQQYNITITDHVVDNAEKLTLPLTENFNFSGDNMVEVIGNKMYFAPLLFMATEQNPFLQEERMYPVDFIFPRQQKFNVIVSVPEGFVIENTPAPLNLAMDANMGTFKFNITQNGNKIQIASTLDINQVIFPSEAYLMLQDFYKKMINKLSDKIVLKQI